MTTCTGRRITRRRPIHRVGVGVVAVGAGEVTAVIERLIRQAAVTETRRGPAVRRVTLPTVDGCGEVSRVLARCIGSIVA